MQAVASNGKIRYLRIPHWVRVTYRSFMPRDHFFDVHLKAKEHRIKRGGLSIRGILFESDVSIPYLTCVAVSVNFTDDSTPFEFDCRVIKSRKNGGDHQFMVTAEFIARTDREIHRIASFARKYY